MRTFVQLTPSQIRALDRLARRLGQSRASLIREAVDDYLAPRATAEDAFGLWGMNGPDGLAFQERARRDW